jgi:hypothetical protein
MLTPGLHPGVSSITMAGSENIPRAALSNALQFSLPHSFPIRSAVA